MEIIEYQSDFLEGLRKIYLESRRESFTWLEIEDFKLSDFDRDTESERIWVALKSDEVIGFISLWEPENFIHHLYVSSEHHKTGVGSKLLEAAKLTYPELNLKCMSHNENALDFYVSQGFVKGIKGSGDCGDYYLMKFITQT
jgi:GNAT superfamily N-acetyltransferase